MPNEPPEIAQVQRTVVLGEIALTHPLGRAGLAALLAAIGEEITSLESDGRDHDLSLKALTDKREALWNEYMKSFKARRRQPKAENDD